MSDQTKRIVYTNAEGNLSIVIPAPNTGLTIQQVAQQSVPAGVTYEIVEVDLIPIDRTFRTAWEHHPVDKVTIDVTKAKEHTHKLRRNKRAEEFKPFDDIIMKQIPGTDVNAAEVSRANIRTKYATLQTQINDCVTAPELKTIIDSEGL